MKRYLFTGISAAVCLGCFITAFALSPMYDKQIHVTREGDIALIIAMISLGVFIISLIVSAVSVKLERRRERLSDDGNNGAKGRLFTRAGYYDEKYDRAEQRRKVRDERRMRE